MHRELQCPTHFLCPPKQEIITVCRFHCSVRGKSSTRNSFHMQNQQGVGETLIKLNGKHCKQIPVLDMRHKGLWDYQWFTLPFADLPYIHPLVPTSRSQDGTILAISSVITWATHPLHIPISWEGATASCQRMCKHSLWGPYVLQNSALNNIENIIFPF